ATSQLPQNCRHRRYTLSAGEADSGKCPCRHAGEWLLYGCGVFKYTQHPVIPRLYGRPGRTAVPTPRSTCGMTRPGETWSWGGALRSLSAGGTMAASPLHRVTGTSLPSRSKRTERLVLLTCGSEMAACWRIKLRSVADIHWR